MSDKIMIYWFDYNLNSELIINLKENYNITSAPIAVINEQDKIYVKNIVKSDFVASLDGGSSVVSESGYSNPLFNLYEVLKSESIAYKVYPIIKEKFPEDLTILGADSKETFFESYTKLINATTEPSTDIIKIKFMWPNQRHAPIVLNEILKNSGQNGAKQPE